MPVDISKSSLREEYQSRINQVQDYIEKHVSEQLTVQKLAEVANFSQFHFQRIFSVFTGETLYQYILRIRLEKAARLLLNSSKLTVTEIALECGFTSSSVFARAFKQFYGVPAKEWVKNPVVPKSRNCKTDSRNCKDSDNETSYNEDAIRQKDATYMIRRKTDMSDKNFTVEVKTMEDTPVAYVRHTGPYKGDCKLFQSLHEKLYRWAGPRELLNFPETKSFTIYHDDPDVKDEDKLRISVFISVPEGTKVDGEIGYTVIPGGKYAVGYFEIDETQYPEIWSFMYGTWLPESGYQPEDGFTFERYLNNPDEHPEKLHFVEIYIPVKPL